MQIFAKIAEERIREAIAAGEFDDLPGSGKPLQLDDYSAVRQEDRLMVKILQNSGYLPPVLHYRKQLEQEAGLLLMKIRKDLEWLGQKRAALRAVFPPEPEAAMRLLQQLGISQRQGALERFCKLPARSSEPLPAGEILQRIDTYNRLHARIFARFCKVEQELERLHERAEQARIHFEVSHKKIIRLPALPEMAQLQRHRLRLLHELVPFPRIHPGAEND